MADGTKISWSDATWNPITGCSIKSPGCTHCYAMKLAGTRLAHHPSRAGLTREVNGNHVWTGEVRFNEGWLDQPTRWQRPRMIFVCAHADLFHEDVPDAWIDRVFAVMALSSRHTYQVLTKRSDRMRAYFTAPHSAPNVVAWQARVSGAIDELVPSRGPVSRAAKDRVLLQRFLPHVWIGVSAERQKEADERQEDLATIADIGWNTFCSYEPALGAVDWAGWGFLRWMISGGENGPRPTHPSWHRTTRDWCAAHGIPFHFKQWGSWIPGEVYSTRDGDTQHGGFTRCIDGEEHGGKPTHWWSGDTFGGEISVKVGVGKAGRLLDGREHNATPFATEA